MRLLPCAGLAFESVCFLDCGCLVVVSFDTLWNCAPGLMVFGVACAFVFCCFVHWILLVCVLSERFPSCVVAWMGNVCMWWLTSTDRNIFAASRAVYSSHANNHPLQAPGGGPVPPSYVNSTIPGIGVTTITAMGIPHHPSSFQNTTMFGPGPQPFINQTSGAIAAGGQAATFLLRIGARLMQPGMQFGPVPLVPCLGYSNDQSPGQAAQYPEA